MKNFGYLIRILLAVVFGTAALYVALNTPYWLSSIWLGLASVICIVDLIRLVTRSDRELTNLLVSIRQGDFTSTYPESLRKSDKLCEAFSTITREFRKVRSDKESGYHFLQAVVEHCGVPMLAYQTESEEITLVNQEAKNLTGIPHLGKLDSIGRFSEELLKSIRQLGPEERVLIRIPVRADQIHLSVMAREIVLQQQRQKLIAIHNINSELDQKEVEAWQKLIRVLSHEIKNSVIPISTLAEVTSAMIADIQNKGQSIRDLSGEESDDLIVSINTIEKRSKGLVKFVSSYSDLAKVPKLDVREFGVHDVVDEVLKLQSKALLNQMIHVRLARPVAPINHTFDKDLIVQVLINLTKNAIEAMPEGGELKIETQRRGNRVSIKIADTGTGIEPEVLEHIFIPFYTTKKDGSGIGLSLSRQILRAHGGTLKASSVPGHGSTFEMIF